MKSGETKYAFLPTLNVHNMGVSVYNFYGVYNLLCDY
jgi:hypothetical protein